MTGHYTWHCVSVFVPHGPGRKTLEILGNLCNYAWVIQQIHLSRQNTNAINQVPVMHTLGKHQLTGQMVNGVFDALQGFDQFTEISPGPVRFNVNKACMPLWACQLLHQYSSIYLSISSSIYLTVYHPSTCIFL